VIHCQKCKHINTPEAEKCEQCMTNLLPGVPIRQRLWGIVVVLICAFIFIAILKWILAQIPFVLSDVPALGAIASIVGALLCLLGVGIGIFMIVERIPRYARYMIRAERHMEIDSEQAIQDFGSALIALMNEKTSDLTLSRTKQIYQERAALYQKAGNTKEANKDLASLLEMESGILGGIKI
jgi:hypothetical protein